MESMPRPRPPFLHREITRHGAVTWYFRLGKGPRIRIRGEFGSAEFLAAYRAVWTGELTPHGGPRTAVESLAWLIAHYRDSRAWTALAPATRRQRELVFKKVAATAGAEGYTNITRQTVMAGLDRRGATPFAAKTFLKALRGLFRWAAENSFIERDPTEGVRIPLPRTEGFHSWTEDEIAQFEARWPIGTRERLALTILLYTGLRRGDAVRLGRQHIKDGIITLRAGKTGTQIIIPVLPELAAIINASRTGDLAFIAGKLGRPMTKEFFGNWFRGACQAAGVPGSAHGLRKAGATRAAENGATVAQLEAIYGWTGGKMASLYTRQADRAKLAREAMGKLGRGKT